MKKKIGTISIVCGCMFAGKTEELIRRIGVLDQADKEVLVFKPAIDDRYSINYIVSHSNIKYKCIPVKEASEILPYITDSTFAVAIDEVQFFDEEIIDVCVKLASLGIKVSAAGLDTDFRGEPFGVMPNLLAIADEVIKLKAICKVCSEEASRTQRLIDKEPAYYDDPLILVSASEKYEPRCKNCHVVKRR